MKGDDNRAEFFSEILAHELAPIEHDSHPDLDLMLAALEGTIQPEVRSKLSAHIATCRSCRVRWKRLSQRVAEATETQKGRTRVPSFDAYVSERVPRRATLVDRLRELFEVRTVTLAAASTAALAVMLAVAIPLLRGPAVRTSEQIEALSSRIEVLQNRLGPSDGLSQFGNDVLSSGDGARPISAPALNAFDWDTVVSYTVRPGENWEDIAKDQLKSADLWPLVWLLNRESGPPDAPPPAGEEIVLPTRRSAR